MSRGQANGKGVDAFQKEQCEKKNAGSNEDDKRDGSAAPTDTLQKGEAMMPIEADWDLYGCAAFLLELTTVATCN